MKCSVLMGVPGFRLLAAAYLCEVCRKSFATKGAARQHSRACFAKPRRRRRKVFMIQPPQTNPTPTRRPKVSPAKPKLVYMCDDCELCFAARLELNKHRKTAHVLLRHECHAPGCKFAAKQLYLLNVHAQMVHGAMREVVDDSSVAPQIDQNGAKKHFECLNKDCRESYSTLAELKKHAVEHLELEHLCPKCGEFFLTLYSLQIHDCHAPEIPDSFPLVASGLDKSLTCQFCGMHMAVQASFDLHVERHRTQSDSVIKCTLKDCKKPFFAPKDLRLHVILSHLAGDADNFIHACDISDCTTEFVSMASLGVHKKEVHVIDVTSCATGKEDNVADVVPVPFAFVEIKQEIKETGLKNSK